MQRPRSRLALGVGSLVLGTATALLNMVEWSQRQNLYSLYPLNLSSTVIAFYLAQALATSLILAGIYHVYRASVLTKMWYQKKTQESTIASDAATTASITSILAQVITSRRLLKVGVVAAVIYALVYAVASGILVYQPSVDFASTYGVTQPGWAYLVCCGDLGTVPKLIVYVSPSLHLGIEFIPLSLIFLFVVPALVGFNIMLSVFAMRKAGMQVTGRWLGASGAILGLFTACPTCAGLFLASSIGGLGTSLAVALAPYQVLFILISIPLLFLTPLLTAVSVKRSYEAACRLPSRAAAAARASAPDGRLSWKKELD